MDLTSKRDTSAEPAQSARRKLVERAPLYLVAFPADVENDEVLRMGRAVKKRSNEKGSRCADATFSDFLLPKTPTVPVLSSPPPPRTVKSEVGVVRGSL